MFLIPGKYYHGVCELLRSFRIVYVLSVSATHTTALYPFNIMIVYSYHEVLYCTCPVDLYFVYMCNIWTLFALEPCFSSQLTSSRLPCYITGISTCVPRSYVHNWKIKKIFISNGCFHNFSVCKCQFVTTADFGSNINTFRISINWVVNFYNFILLHFCQQITFYVS